MGSEYEIIGTNKVKVTFAIPAEKFRESLEEAYKRNRGKINVPGFRKGRAPRKIIEINFGKEIFYEDAVNIALPEVYEATVLELGLEVVSRPEIDLSEISEENGATVTAEVFTKPEIQLTKEDYEGVLYDPLDETVSDDEINAEINKTRERNARMISVERPIEEGDTAIIDFEGFTDGIPFEGGKGEDYTLNIGSHTFVDTFEEQLKGKSKGDSAIVNVTFPEDYRSENLAGKPAEFKVLVKEVRFKELPEVDDDFAQDISEFDTLDAYKADIENKLSESKKQAAKQKKEDDLVRAVIEKLNMDIPEIMIENQIDQMVNDFSNQISTQGIPFNNYLEYMGQTVEALRNAYRANAENQVKGRLVLEAVAKSENIEVTDFEIENEVKRIADGYGIEQEKLDKLMSKEDKNGLVTDIKVKKALDIIVSRAVESVRD